MRIVVLFVLISISLSGCTGLIERGNSVYSEGAESVRAVNDSNLIIIEDLYCNAQARGSLVRRYGSNSELWDAYWNLCNTISSLTGSITTPQIPDDIPNNL